MAILTVSIILLLTFIAAILNCKMDALSVLYNQGKYSNPDKYDQTIYNYITNWSIRYVDGVHEKGLITVDYLFSKGETSKLKAIYKVFRATRLPDDPWHNTKTNYLIVRNILILFLLVACKSIPYFYISIWYEVLFLGIVAIALGLIWFAGFELSWNLYFKKK